MGEMKWDEFLELLLEDSIDAERFGKLRGAIASSIEVRHRLEEAGEGLKDRADALGKRLSRAEADVKRGLALWLLGRSAEALETVSGSKLSEGRYVAGMCALELGLYEEAIKRFEAVLKEQKDNFLVKCKLLESKVKSAPSQSVMQEINAEIKKKPRSPELHYVRGLLNHYLCDYDKEMQDYEKAVELSAEFAPALLRLGFLYGLTESIEEAEAFYRRLSELRPTYASALINLGLLYEDMREYERAAQCYRLVLRTYPTNERARMYLEDALSAMKMYEVEKGPEVPKPTPEELKVSISELDLSTRTRNALLSAGVQTLGELIEKTEAELLATRSIGEHSIDEIKAFLARRGLGLREAERAITPLLPSAGPPVVPSPEALEMSIEELGLSLRTVKALDAAGISKVGQIIEKTEKEMLAIRHFGRISLQEVKEKLAEKGLRLREVGEAKIE